MNTEIDVSDEAFEYLRLQKGSLDKFSHDRPRWLAAYRTDLQRTFDEIKPWLPERCWALLDIGSGLGGIDALLSRHYDGGPFVNLLDGVDDRPQMNLHRQTFSNERVARNFLRANGVRGDRIRYHGPTATAEDLRAPYDLVVSFGSWCFHYEPNEYLPRLLAGGGLHAESVVIVDVRAGKKLWHEQLEDVLRPIKFIRSAQKYMRVAYARR